MSLRCFILLFGLSCCYYLDLALAMCTAAPFTETGADLTIQCVLNCPTRNLLCRFFAQCAEINLCLFTLLLLLLYLLLMLLVKLLPAVLSRLVTAV